MTTIYAIKFFPGTCLVCIAMVGTEGKNSNISAIILSNSRSPRRKTSYLPKNSNFSATSKGTWLKHFNNCTSSQRGIQICRKSSQVDRTFRILICCSQYPTSSPCTTFPHHSRILTELTLILDIIKLPEQDGGFVYTEI